jgi:hypothetical protein
MFSVSFRLTGTTVAVGEGDGVNVIVGVTVAVGVIVAVGVTSGVAVKVDVGVADGVAVISAVGVSVGVSVTSAVGVTVSVAVTEPAALARNPPSATVPPPHPASAISMKISSAARMSSRARRAPLDDFSSIIIPAILFLRRFVPSVSYNS